MRTDARAVVIGGGVGGCSILYHLAKLGWSDVVLVEQYGLTHGSTWHSAGLVGQLRSTVSLTKMMQYSVGLYADLKDETGKDPGWHELGGLRLASSKPAHGGAAAPGRLGEELRAAGRDHLGGRGAGAVPADEHRRRAGRGLPPAGWLPRSQPADIRAGRRRPPAGRRHRAAHPRRGDHPQGRPRARGRHGQGHDPHRRRDQCRRHVRAADRADGGRRRPDHPLRARVPGHRGLRSSVAGYANAP